MAKDYTILIGTVGQDLNVSSDGGESWTHVGSLDPRKTIPDEGNFRALCVYPDNPRRVLAGSDGGVFRSEDGGVTWVTWMPPHRTLSSGRRMWTPRTRTPYLWARGPMVSAPGMGGGLGASFICA